MKIHTLTRSQWLPIPMDVAWAFFSNPANLPAITPPWLAFKVTCDLPKTIYPGMLATYTIQVLPIAFLKGITIPWVTEITHLREQEYFVDEQRFGPYQFWHHQHHFTSTDGGVEIQDIVNYALPVGVFGKLAHGVFVRRQLEEIFNYRQKALEEFFGGDTG